MALTPPARLRNAELNALSKRAAQLNKVKPAISYWCYYQIVNHILKDGLHTQDEECKAYTMELMDKLEEMKTEHPQDDTITDDVAAQAYVEQFALETLQRGENAMDANKVTNQTPDTLLAAATFLDLLAIWSPLSAETSAKVKFAKYHAVRIVRAIKAGQDPNASNPIKETELADDSTMALDPNDPDVQAITGTRAADSTVTDEARVEAPVASAMDQGSSGAPGIVRTTTSGMTPSTGVKQDLPLQQSANVSPGAPSPLHPDDRTRQDSMSDGYFPRVSPASPLADVAAEEKSVSPNEAGTASSEQVEPKANAEDVPQAPSTPADVRAQPVQPVQTVKPVQPAQSLPTASPAQSVKPVQQVQPTVQAADNYETNDEAVAAAMKHAKWATSALNFDDVPTAIKELREALRSLGAS